MLAKLRVHYTPLAKPTAALMSSRVCVPTTSGAAGGKRRRDAYDALIASPLYEPEMLDVHLSPAAMALVKDALARLDGPVVDYHCHVAGRGRGSSCCVHPSMRDDASLLDASGYLNRAKMRVFMCAFGTSAEDEDAAVAARLARLARHTPGGLRCMLLAFDQRHDKATGQPQPLSSAMLVPNDHVYGLAKAHPDIFSWACSVNPYRRDACEELERCHKLGARVVKWLPNSMLIDPADAACDGFYACCARLGMALLCHTGDETSVDFLGARVRNELGNPLRLRRALDAGVRVIAAHCASEGKQQDDAVRRSGALTPGLADLRPICLLARAGPVPGQGAWRPCHELLFEMMERDEWKELLFADISALILFRRLHVLVELLARPALFPRLVFGSDYPVPALGGRAIGMKPQPIAVRHGGAFTAQLVSSGLIDARQCELLLEVFNYNPVLFDLVLKLTVRHPTTGARLPASVFGAHPMLPVSGKDTSIT